MNAELEHLISLQALDLDLKRLREELAEAPKRVASAQTARARAELALTAAKQSLTKEEVLRRSQETDARERRDKIARLRKQMETATSAAQITALEHEILFAEQAISRLEDEEIESLERTDELEKQRDAATVLLERTTADLAAERARAAAVEKSHTTEIKALAAEREMLRGEIGGSDKGEALLSSYDRVAKAKGTAISEAVDHKCSACQMLVRPQRWNDLTGRDFRDTIFNCETCGRMLFWDPRRDKPGDWPPGERLRNAMKAKG
jgi:predicted  nucleic acid-binding Zn-ribbon protein